MANHLYSWLTGYILGVCGKPLTIPKRVPVAYRYNEVNIPKLLAPADHPYLYIGSFYSRAYAFTEELINVTTNPFIHSVTPEIAFLQSELTVDENGIEYWKEWKEVSGGTTIYMSATGWANHTILKTDGSIYLAVCEEPTAVYLPTTLFDGEVTTKFEGDWADSASATCTISDVFVVGDTVRVTINGVSGEYTLRRVATSNQIQVGNSGLNGNDVDAPDDGGDWLFALVSEIAPSLRRVYFYTRTAGTYKVKIERIATASTPVPVYE